MFILQMCSVVTLKIVSQNFNKSNGHLSRRHETSKFHCRTYKLSNATAMVQQWCYCWEFLVPQKSVWSLAHCSQGYADTFPWKGRPTWAPESKLANPMSANILFSTAKKEKGVFFWRILRWAGEIFPSAGA